MTDDSKAIHAAFAAACAYSSAGGMAPSAATLLFPAPGSFFLTAPTLWVGPCKGAGFIVQVGLPKETSSSCFSVTTVQG